MTRNPSSEDGTHAHGDDRQDEKGPDTLRENAQEYRSESPENDAVRDEVMAHYQESVKRNHRLAKLLAQ